jgi:hypothetical protein
LAAIEHDLAIICARGAIVPGAISARGERPSWALKPAERRFHDCRLVETQH